MYNLLRLLLQANADCGNEAGDAPLHYALRSGDTEGVQVLLRGEAGDAAETSVTTVDNEEIAVMVFKAAKECMGLGRVRSALPLKQFHANLCSCACCVQSLLIKISSNSSHSNSTSTDTTCTREQLSSGTCSVQPSDADVESALKHRARDDNRRQWRRN